MRTPLVRFLRSLPILTLGAAIAALGYASFQVPYDIAAGGVGGLAILLHEMAGWPPGTVILLLNLPLLALGFRELGGWRFLASTTWCVVVFSVLVDLLGVWLPRVVERFPLTDNVLLASIYGAIVGGIGSGLAFRAGATMGGTSILGRIVQARTGLPLSQTYLYTDGLIVVAAGVVFGWELALYAMLTLVLGGMASDYVLEGPSTVRVANVVTEHPEEMMKALMIGLDRGVTRWDVRGGYTGDPRTLLMCTVHRAQVPHLKEIVAEVDPGSFLIIGAAHQALGQGFHPLRAQA